MSFLQGTFLFGAAAVLGPILAHMLAKPRFRRVPFTMVRFLRERRHESYARRNLRDLLILLLRCAIIVLIAMLFARPVLHVKAEPPAPRSIHHLALDDSVSMSLRDGAESLFERMQDRTIAYVRQAPADASFSIHGLASRHSLHDLTRAQAIAEISRFDPVPKRAHLTDFLSSLQQAGRTLSPADTLAAALFSDFTPGALAEFERVHEPAAVDALHYERITPTNDWTNARIATAHATDFADNELVVEVTIINSGPTEQQRELTLTVEDLEPVSTPLVLKPHERRVSVIQVDLGPHGGKDVVCLPVELSLAPADDLEQDDSYRLAVFLPQADSLKVLVVHRERETFLFETALDVLASRQPPGVMQVKRVTEDRLGREHVAWADVVVLSSVPDEASLKLDLLESHLRRGGRLVVFATQAGRPEAVQHLLRERVLAAVPEGWVEEVCSPEGRPTGNGRFSEDVIRSLLNYQTEGIALKGFWRCRMPPEAECVWRLGNGAGFIYVASLHGGTSILVNTSIDDSRGLLAKSSAWVAFCQLLLGRDDRVRQVACHTEQRPALPLPQAARAARTDAATVENCDGSRSRAVVDNSRMLLPSPSGTGWMKTVDTPALYAGINLPEGETELAWPADEAVALAMKRAFMTDPPARTPARAASIQRDKPVWKLLAWATILLLLVEPAITNRLKR